MSTEIIAESMAKDDNMIQEIIMPESIESILCMWVCYSFMLKRLDELG